MDDATLYPIFKARLAEIMARRPKAAVAEPIVSVEPPVAPSGMAPVIAAPTAADLEFDRVRKAALARRAADLAEAAEVDKAVAAILAARALIA